MKEDTSILGQARFEGGWAPTTMHLLANRAMLRFSKKDIPSIIKLLLSFTFEVTLEAST
jgi:hypothetical protein